MKTAVLGKLARHDMDKTICYTVLCLQKNQPLKWNWLFTIWLSNLILLKTEFL